MRFDTRVGNLVPRQMLAAAAFCTLQTIAAGAYAQSVAPVPVATVRPGGTAAGEPAPKLPQHVFLIVLENESYKNTFGSGDKNTSEFWKTFEPYSVNSRLLTNYYAIGHNSLVNYIAMISGQPPNWESKQDCLHFEALEHSLPLDERGVTRNQAHGCVYPPQVPTIAEQIEKTNKLTWRAYMEDMGNAVKVATIHHPHSESATCRYPDKIGDLDCTNQSREYDTDNGPIYDQYTVRHNPFVYFQSITDNQSTCDQHDVALDRLKSDLNHIGTTPNLVFISPNLCNDGHDGGNEASKDRVNLPHRTTKLCNAPPVSSHELGL